MKYKNIEIKWLGHSGFLLKGNGQNIYIDPFKLNSYEKADIILITHGHYDHFSVEDLRKIIKPGAKFIGPADILSQTRPIGAVNFEIAEPGKKIDYNGINIDCVHAYNINKSFHKKEEAWVGYIIKINGVRVYHAGDSDLIPEMKNIKADVALLPVSGKYVMTSEEASRAAEIIKPELAVPMHWGSVIGEKSDADNFVKLCKEKGINAMVLEKGA